MKKSLIWMPILVFCATVFTVNKAIAQSPGTLTIRDDRNCEDTLFFLAEAEPLNNTPCGAHLAEPVEAYFRQIYIRTTIPIHRSPFPSDG